jgi:hypothetical protein
MRVFAIGIENALNMPVQSPHDADARHHGGSVILDDQEQRFDRGLLFRGLLFGLREPLDIFGGVLEGDKLTAAGKRDRIIERPFPALRCHQANISAPAVVNFT